MDAVNDTITVIITMAGTGTRFRKAGYNCPKYMIEAHGKTLFEWSMDSLIGYNSHVIQYVFVVLKEDNARDFILHKSAICGIRKASIVELDHLTDGQATTCLYALPYCTPDLPILIYNIDTYVEPNILKFEDIKGNGYIPCFHADGDHWSFVKADCNGNVLEVREKNRISNNCTLGAYYFSSARLFQELYEKYYSDNCHVERNEKYIAPIYNYMIQQGFKVTYSIVDANKVHVLGTPEELDAFNANFQMP